MALGCYFSEKKKKYKSLNTELLNVNSGSVDKAMTMLNLVFFANRPPRHVVFSNWNCSIGFQKKKKQAHDVYLHERRAVIGQFGLCTVYFLFQKHIAHCLL